MNNSRVDFDEKFFNSENNYAFTLVELINEKVVPKQFHFSNLQEENYFIEGVKAELQHSGEVIIEKDGHEIKIIITNLEKQNIYSYEDNDKIKKSPFFKGEAEIILNLWGEVTYAKITTYDLSNPIEIKFVRTYFTNYINEENKSGKSVVNTYHDDIRAMVIEINQLLKSIYLKLNSK